MAESVSPPFLPSTPVRQGVDKEVARGGSAAKPSAFMRSRYQLVIKFTTKLSGKSVATLKIREKRQRLFFRNFEFLLFVSSGGVGEGQ
ncbi:hypothetical protein CEXT_758391 [Caerostris extrusa]|uniref:Uncharacterized protein n=1 Tax=Caerostris extrusa TaxID=172846 RepID=A0AAV4N7W9_CAEEX|nr:hypothetical protein CEXT_758391 [Caerostris extrusa]